LLKVSVKPLDGVPKNVLGPRQKLGIGRSIGHRYGDRGANAGFDNLLEGEVNNHLALSRGSASAIVPVALVALALARRNITPPSAGSSWRASWLAVPKGNQYRDGRHKDDGREAYRELSNGAHDAPFGR